MAARASRGGAEPLAYALALPQQQIAHATAGYVPAQMARSYRWGQVHGWLLIVSALFLFRPHPWEKITLSTVFLVVLGVCVLRRNKLILPLMAAWLAIQLSWILVHRVFLTGEPLIPLVLWCLYLVYYYRRRNEFVAWL